jgi:hypothetical protein
MAQRDSFRRPSCAEKKQSVYCCRVAHDHNRLIEALVRTSHRIAAPERFGTEGQTCSSSMAQAQSVAPRSWAEQKQSTEPSWTAQAGSVGLKSWNGSATTLLELLPEPVAD